MKKVGDVLQDKLSGIKNEIKVHKLPEPKKTKNGLMASYKPTLYLDAKDFEGIKGFEAGQKVYLAMECTVVSKAERAFTDSKGKEVENVSVDLEIESIADITGVG